MAKIPFKDSSYELELKTYVFGFGKNSGKTFKEVWETNPSYIDWCAKDKVLPIPTTIVNRYGRDKIVADHKWIEERLGSIKNIVEDFVFTKEKLIDPLHNFDWIKF